MPSLKPSWKPWFEFSNGEWASNGQAFATKEEAEASAHARFMVWTMPVGYEARESNEDVNYRWDEQQGDVICNRTVSA